VIYWIAFIFLLAIGIAFGELKLRQINRNNPKYKEKR